jgi:6-phosphogluconolactonase (cycloisomerase 2 family)
MSADIHISPDGKFLYASNRGDQNNISIFSIQEDGTLKEVGYQSTLGEHPRIFAIDPSGQFLIVTNLISGDVIVFRRDINTGLLKKVGKKVKIENVSFVQIRHYK